MSAPSVKQTIHTLEEWQRILRGFKEKLAERLWTLPAVSEAEKEAIFKEYLMDLDSFERQVAQLLEQANLQQNQFDEENKLLRRLMGLNDDQVRDQNFALGLDLESAKKHLQENDTELRELRKKLSDSEEENKLLRTKLQRLEVRSEDLRMNDLKKREDDIRFFSESQEKLTNQLKDLETRIGNLRELYKESNQKLLTEKQSEISALQKNLFEDMSSALRKKQDMMWAEEELFAQGVAHRVRTALVSAQGQLYLTLERLGLMDPETKSEAFWKARLQLLVKGANELSRSFRSVTDQIQDITKSLDDYLHLTGRRKLANEPVDLKELIQRQIAEIYVDRRPGLHLEFLSDDPLPAIDGDRELLQFIVKTLLRNALEALSDGNGAITINIKNRGLDRGLQVLIRDSGSGIPTNLRSRLFQPFFTTKEGRQGFSLSRSKRYAELHGGDLTLIETSPSGSLFQLELPILRSV